MAKGKTREGMAHAGNLYAGQSYRLAIAALVALAAVAAQATTWYVSPSGDGTDPTAGFATGFPTIKAALANASLADDDVVLLDRATFDLSYENRAKEIANSGGTISKRIVLSGVGTKEETVIDGGRERNTNGTEWTRRYNDHHPQLVIAVDGVVVQNMTFQRMGSQYHATISLSGHNNCTISNVVIRNTGLGYPNGVAGYTDKAMLYLTGNSNAGNRILNCVFTNNVSNGPVVWLDGSQNGNRMENCYIAENRCTGVAYNNGVAYMSVGNQYSGGLGRFCNNTIVNNKSKLGAVNQSGQYFMIVNNIVYGNTDLDGTAANNYANVNNSTKIGRWVYNCIGEGSATFSDTANNIFLDPKLAEDRFHLQSTSPCIGRGNTSYALAADIDGVPRGDPPCIGCSEFVSSATFTCAITNNAPASAFVSVPETITLGVTIDGTPTLPLSYAWDLDGDGVADTNGAEVVLSEPGRYNVTVWVMDANENEVSAMSDTAFYIYPEEKVFYVVSGGNPTSRSPYLTWETAATTIADAYSHARRFSGSRIVLGDGVHTITSTLLLTNALVVASANGCAHTKISRGFNNLGTSLVTIDDPDSVLEGVTLVSGGKIPYVAGVFVNSGTMRGCAVTGWRHTGGGTVYMNGASVNRPARLERCVIANNTANGSGTIVGVYMMRHSTMENCLVTNNVSDYSSSSVSGVGAGVNCASVDAVIRNCTFADNRGANAPPLFFQYAPGVFENNIVTGGTTNGTDGVAAANDCTAGFNATLIRNLNNCCLYPAALDYSEKTVVLTCAPGFVGPGDCHLSVQSPCVNAGVLAGYTEESLDLDGKPRIYRRKVDIGCYENQQALGLMAIIQ